MIKTNKNPPNIPISKSEQNKKQLKFVWRHRNPNRESYSSELNINFFSFEQFFHLDPCTHTSKPSKIDPIGHDYLKE